MKAKLFLFACLLSAGAFGQDAPAGPKVYIEFESNDPINLARIQRGLAYADYPTDSLEVRSGIYKPNQATLVPWTHLPATFAKWCPECRVTVKKEAADYVLMLRTYGNSSFDITSKIYGSWSPRLYENKEGTEIKVPSGEVNTFRDAVRTLREHYASIQKVQ